MKIASIYLKFLPILCFALCSAFAGWYLHHQTILSGGNIIMGDIYDSRLIILIQEHWFKIFNGNATWRDLGMFYPVNNSLGFSDTFLLFGLSHSLIRLLGFDIFQAAAINSIHFIIIGISGMTYLLNKVFKFDYYLSLSLGLIFVLISPINVGPMQAHWQLWITWYMPWVTVFFCKFTQNLHKSFASYASHGFSFAFSLALCLYTAFYIPWFYIFYLGIIIAITIAVSICKIQSHKTHNENSLYQCLITPIRCINLRPILFVGGLFTVFNIPLLITYLPILKNSGPQPFEIVLKSLPYIGDLVNSSVFNFWWGYLLEHFPNRYPIHGFGLPPFTMLCLISVLLIAVLSHRKNPAYWIIAIMTAGILTSWLLMLRVGNFSLWEWVYDLIPGASAIRVVYRFNAMLMIPAIIISGYVLSNGIFKINNSQRRVFTIGLILSVFVVVIMEQLMRTPDRGSSILKSSEQSAFIKSIPAPPSDTKVFYVWRESHAEAMTTELDAWAIAQYFNLKTINGYSGVLPPDYQLRGYLNGSLSEYELAIAYG